MDDLLAIVDVGLGNLRSVERAVRHCLGDAPTRLVTTGDPGAVREASRVIVPGQGAFGDCSAALGRDGGALARALRDHIAADRPYLGICLGLQVLFESSEEAPGCGGLGVFPGAVTRLREGLRAPDGTRARIPHMGWNRVAARGAGAGHWRAGAWFYFVHSYRVVPDAQDLVAGTTTHGEPFVSAVARGSLLAVQFHPEKSHDAGLDLLARFLARPRPTAASVPPCA